MSDSRNNLHKDTHTTLNQSPETQAATELKSSLDRTSAFDISFTEEKYPPRFPRQLAKTSLTLMTLFQPPLVKKNQSFATQQKQALQDIVGLLASQTLAMRSDYAKLSGDSLTFGHRIKIWAMKLPCLSKTVAIYSLINRCNDILVSEKSAEKKVLEVTEEFIKRAAQFKADHSYHNFQLFANTKHHHEARMVMGVLQHLLALSTANTQLHSLANRINTSKVLADVYPCSFKQYSRLKLTVNSKLDEHGYIKIKR